MNDEIEKCCRCGKPLTGRDRDEVIYIRVSRFGRWGNEACCTWCWEHDHPDGCEPVRFLRGKFDAEEPDDD